jgi:hypothetical protein
MLHYNFTVWSYSYNAVKTINTALRCGMHRIQILSAPYNLKCISLPAPTGLSIVTHVTQYMEAFHHIKIMVFWDVTLIWQTMPTSEMNTMPLGRQTQETAGSRKIPAL